MTDPNDYGVVDRLLIKCDCLTHALELVYIEDKYDGDNSVKKFELSAWQLMNSDRPLCWRQKIRWIWRILRTGMPWTDMMIISDDKAKEIVEFINKHTK